MPRSFIPIRFCQLGLGSGLRIKRAAEQEDGGKHDPGWLKMLAMVPASAPQQLTYRQRVSLVQKLQSVLVLSEPKELGDGEIL